jgi:hypothetical protein
MPAAPRPQQSPLTVLVDDVRVFRDERPALVARSSQEALRLLDELGGKRIDDLWLDHDLVGDDTIRPVVDWTVQRANAGSPLNVGQIHIHSSNVGAGHWMRLELEAAGYPVLRSFALGMWIRGC